MARVHKLVILIALIATAPLAALAAPAVLAAPAAPSAPAAPAATPRFQGYVAGAVTGPGHSFFVGDGLNLVFRDRRHAGTRYTACWKGPDGDKHCWHRTTGARGNVSRIPTAAPDHVGSYIVRWTVNHHVVAHWRFYNHIGD